MSRCFEPIDGNRVFDRVNEITGLPLIRKGRYWYGACYLNGSPHSRMNKTTVTLIKGSVLLLEQGGDAMNIQQWLIRFGGASGWSHACDILKGADRPIVTRHYEPIIKEVRYVYQSILDKAKTTSNHSNSNLFKWMCTMFPEYNVRMVFDMYNITSNYKGDTVFWYVDAKGRICRDKVMRYLENGKRDKTFGGYTEFTIKNGFTGRCCFGAHLIGDNPVACVESEKTAILAALSHPEHTWVATGGKGKVNMVEQGWGLYPDMDAIELWGKYGSVVEWWKDWDAVESNSDVGDKIVDILKNIKGAI